jgi:3-deoxy-D-manno-octulosonic-acid transferase
MAILRGAPRAREPARLPERLGIAACPAGRSAFWFHAASVGTNAVLPHARVEARCPSLNFCDRHCHSRIAAEPARGAIHQFMPLDSPRFCQGFIGTAPGSRFRRSEIWPNLIVEASDKKIPTLVNGRMSPRSAGAGLAVEPVKRFRASIRAHAEWASPGLKLLACKRPSSRAI